MSEKHVISAPFIKHPDNVRAIMCDLMIALLPVCAWGVYAFGVRVLSIILVSVTSAIVTETALEVISKKPLTAGDFSAMASGLVTALLFPVTVPLYVPAIASAFAMGAVKFAFGGLGENFLNPALTGYVFARLCFPEKTSIYVLPFVDEVTAATPLASLHGGNLPSQSLFDMITGQKPGSIGEVSALLILAGGIYLMIRGVVDFRIPLGFIGAVAALTIAFPQNVSGVMFMADELLAGSLMFCAFIAAPDPSTSPATRMGKLIFGAVAGGFTVLLRYFGSAPEGTAYAVLMAELLSGFIEKITSPRRFGGKK